MTATARRPTGLAAAPPERPSVKPPSLLGRGLVRHGYPLVLLGLLGMLVFGRLVEQRPFRPDNLVALSLGHRLDPASIIQNRTLWRPVSRFTIWAQYHLAGIAHVESWFLANLLLWVACAYAVYLCVYRISASQLGGLLASAATLVDGRTSEEVVRWIWGRQTTLACLCGLLALLVAVRPTRRPRPATWLAVYGLLLAAALSKEPGLAFSAALVVAVSLERVADRRTLQVAAVAAALSYAALRLAVGGSGLDNYCEDMGFFSADRRICYSQVDALTAVQQRAYNVAAMFLGTLLPGLFQDVGRIEVQPTVLAGSAVWLLLAAVGWAGLPRRTLALLALVACSAALNFNLYRDRNQVFGMLGLYIAAGVGLAQLRAWDSRGAAGRLVLAAVLAVALVLIGAQAMAGRRFAEAEVQAMLRRDPCRNLSDPQRGHRYERAVIVGLKWKYGMPDPDCAGISGRGSEGAGP